MKKIISLFKRNYKGNHLVYDEVVPGAEWVIAGEGVATVKYDGTCCMVRDGKLYKRYDRKLTKGAAKCKRRDKDFVPTVEHFKPAPANWEAAELEPNVHTGHWPGWLPVGDGPEDKWHREAWENHFYTSGGYTCELVGPKMQGNPYQMDSHRLIMHSEKFTNQPPRDFKGIRRYLLNHHCEGIVWHHPDGRMVKIKRRDFGLPWPPNGD